MYVDKCVLHLWCVLREGSTALPALCLLHTTDAVIDTIGTVVNRNPIFFMSCGNGFTPMFDRSSPLPW